MIEPPPGLSEKDREFHFGANLWQGMPNESRRALTRYIEAMIQLANQILRLLAAALSLPHDFFVRYHTHPMCALRCINYPATDQPLLAGQRGAGEHSDYGSLTILKPDPRAPGLEIKLPSGQWQKAPLIEKGFIINIGDMLARWTNDRWVSTLHRVVHTDENNQNAIRRQSLAFFHNSNLDAEIRCIPSCLGSDLRPIYAPIVAGDYLHQRYTSTVS